MISIKTNLKNINWLKYIVEQFKNINLANFEIEVQDEDLETFVQQEYIYHYGYEHVM